MLSPTQLTAVHPFYTFRSDFDSISRSLNLDEETGSKAWELLSHIPMDNGAIPAEDQTNRFNYMCACALYIACKPNGSSSNGVALTQILRRTNVERVVDFLGPLKWFINQLNLGSEYSSQFYNLEKKFSVLYILYQKYEKEFVKYFATKQQVDQRQQIFKFGWLLFLISKSKILSEPPDLVDSFYLLLCVIYFIVKHFVKFDANSNEITLECIATKASAEQFQDHIKKINETKFLKFIESLQKTNMFKVSETGSTTPLVGLDYIEKEYEMIYYASGDFDERSFLGSGLGQGIIESTLGTPNRVSQKFREAVTTPGQRLAAATPSPRPRGPRTPARANLSATVPMTPVSAALEVVGWRKKIKRNEKGVGAQLKEIIGSAEHSEALKEKLEGRVGRLIVEYKQQTGNSVSESFVDFGEKVYFVVLQDLMIFEKTRFDDSSLGKLLSHEGFNSGLIFLSFKIINYLRNKKRNKRKKKKNEFDEEQFRLIAKVDYLDVLTNIDFYRRVNLPEEIMDLLRNYRSEILESLLWSPPYGQIWSMGTLYDHVSSDFLTKINEMCKVEIKEPAVTKNATPGKTSEPAKVQPKQRAVESVLNMLFSLLAVKLHKIAAALRISPVVHTQIYLALTNIFLKHSIQLMKGRHIDQILLCTIYGISKVHQINKSGNSAIAGNVELKWKDILDAYKKCFSQPRGKEMKGIREVYRNVKMGEGTGNIIQFYNDVFIPELESVLYMFSFTNVQVGDSQENIPKRKQNLKVLNSPFPLSPMPVTGNANSGYLTPFPLQRTPLPLSSPMVGRTPLSMTPMREYVIGKSPRSDLKAINLGVNTPRSLGLVRDSIRLDNVTPTRNRASKRLFEDEDEDEEEDDPKKKGAGLEALASIAGEQKSRKKLKTTK